MTITGLEKKLGDFSLNVENLVLPRPGIYGLVGPNGSGKSTLAKLITGLLEPDRGKVDPEGLGYRDITLLSRKPYMMDDTVYNNLVYPLQIRNIVPDPKMTAEYMDIIGFSRRQKQKARLLSGGEQQKLSLLRALIFRPRFIVADEAMTALDIDSLDFFEKLILESRKKDPVIWVIISHQMPHVRRLAGKFFFMYQGKIESEGDAEEIFSHPDNSHLKQYLRAYGGGVPDYSVAEEK
jgi:ABC-type multidrug transport system ATPase subunit